MILTCADLVQSKLLAIKLLVPIKYQFRLFGKIWNIWVTVKSLCNTDNR